LNQLSFYNVSSLEILKGPGGSMYGAGMGGVMLINSVPFATNNQLLINFSKGSYRFNNLNVAAMAGSESFHNVLSYSRQNSDGYRQQSAMQREVVSWHTKIKSSENQSLSTHLLFGDLFYETPGGLTKGQYLKDPKAARPANAVFPGAIQNNASIHQKMFWAGINHHYTFSEHWKNTTAVYGAFAQIRNPSIRNYERRLEPNFGGRTAFNLNTSIKETDVHIVVGGEFQQGYADIKVYKNNKGKPDSLQSNDEVNNHQALLFAQADLRLQG
jgi:iron complex outermembrane recepter protein